MWYVVKNRRTGQIQDCTRLFEAKAIASGLNRDHHTDEWIVELYDGCN